MTGKTLATMLALLPIITLSGCSSSEELRTGDLAFALSDSGRFDRAISSATAGTGTRDYSHVGIVFEDDRGMMIIEAVPDAGVSICTVDEFIERNRDVDFYRLTGAKFDPDKVIETAKSHLGEEYDYTYLPENSMMYCSELVYESFRTAEGDHIFKSKPMNFYSEDGSLDDFWADLFADLGMDVPQDVPGTNPNDMSQDLRLSLIKETRN